MRPHSDREINFVFQPSLGGSFHETLVVGNVYDPSNDQVVTLKATISRADTFWLNTSNIDFGTVTPDEWSRPQGIVILNNSKQSRTYVLKAADYVFDDRATKSMPDTKIPILRFILEEKRKRSLLSSIAPEEEAIEALERKGIALERKGKADKAAKIRRQVTELRARLASASQKKSDAPPTEVSKSDKNYGMSSKDNHGDYAMKESDPGASGNRTVLVPKGSDGYISLTLKGGDSKVSRTGFPSFLARIQVGILCDVCWLVLHSNNLLRYFVNCYGFHALRSLLIWTISLYCLSRWSW